VSREIPVLLEDNHLLALAKPARLLVAPDETGDESLLDQARDYLRVKYQKPGNVFVGLVHRIDRPVSGVVLFARTDKAASRLSEQFRVGSVDKRYLAAVRGAVPDEGELVDWLWKDESTNVVRSVAPGTAGAKESRLRFRRLGESRSAGIRHASSAAPTSGARRSAVAVPISLVEVQPLTGRSHQIRVQLATAGFPIEGDVKYGGTAGWDGAIALHAWSLTVKHPTRDERLVITTLPPTEWRQHGVHTPRELSLAAPW
jgi:23S rRNA pseudouridine1911/1915/1917 synthase